MSSTRTGGQGTSPARGGDQQGARGTCQPEPDEVEGYTQSEVGVLYGQAVLPPEASVLCGPARQLPVSSGS